MSSIAIVTDSTADIAPADIRELGLYVVPLTVNFGDESFISGEGIDPEAFYSKLAASTQTPTTSQPSPAQFDEMYARCAADGYDAVVSVHCSAQLSGTWSVAYTQAPLAPLPVTVIDTRLVGGALSLAAIRAQRVASGGGTVEEIVDAVQMVTDDAIGLLVVDTLEYLRRGGRLHGAQAAIGTALRVKPILHLIDGRVEVFERTRTWSRAVERVVELVETSAAGRAVELSIVAAGNAEPASQLHASLAHRLTVARTYRAMIGPIVGTHVGPGAIGVAAVPA